MDLRISVVKVLGLFSPGVIAQTSGPSLLRRGWGASILLMMLTVAIGRYLYERRYPEWMVGLVFYPYIALLIYMALFICIGTWRTAMRWESKALAFVVVCGLLPLQLFLLLAFWMATMMGIFDAPRTME